MLKKTLSILALIAIGLIGRLAPHVPNTTPVAAIAFSAAKYVGRFWAVAVPLCVMAVSDTLIGFYDWRVLVSVYGSFAAIGCIGILARHARPAAVMLAVMGASVLFFLTTNFAVWAASSSYPHTLLGLIECYLAGLPFFRNMFIGDVFYSAAMMGAFGWIFERLRERAAKEIPNHSVTRGFHRG